MYFEYGICVKIKRKLYNAIGKKILRKHNEVWTSKYKSRMEQYFNLIDPPMWCIHQLFPALKTADWAGRLGKFNM